MIGTTISHFEILEKLGGGGMGVVYKARDLNLDRIVALKFLPRELMRDDEVRERFVQEAKAASSLDDPNIGAIFEIDETEDGRLFIAMAYYDGGSLDLKTLQGPVPFSEALDIAARIAGGLGQAHGAGIVHRDIKPANVLLTAGGEVKIVDFGLAKLSEQAGMTRVGSTVGTAAYMSPEQAEGREVDHRTDLWSLGVTLFEMLTGSLPFGGDSVPARLHAIVYEEPAMLAASRPEIAGAVQPILGRLLEKDPVARYGSAAEVENDLRALARAVDPSRGTEIFSQPMVPVRRRRIGWRGWVRIGGLVVVVLGGLWLSRNWPVESVEASAFNSLAVMPFENLTGDPGQEYLARGVSVGLITHLNEVAELRVVSRSRAWQAFEEGATSTQLAKQLGVAALLEGEMQLQDDQIRVTAHLTDGASGDALWSKPFEGRRVDLFSLQEEIARAVTELLKIPLSRGERSRLTRDPTRSFQAYDAYLRGQQNLAEMGHRQSLVEAIARFNEAIDADPEFALAHVALSEALWRSFLQERSPGMLDTAESHAEKALELDPELSSAAVALARVYRVSGREEESIEKIESVMAKHPKPDEALLELAVSYEAAGDLEKAEEFLRGAVARGPGEWSNYHQLGGFFLRLGKLDEAIFPLEQAALQAPEGITWPQENLALAELLRGDFEEAIARFERIPAPSDDPEFASNMGTAYFFAGDTKRAEALYQRAITLNPRDTRFHSNLADVYLRRDELVAARLEYERAFALIEEALATSPENVELQLARALYASKAAKCDVAVPAADELDASLPRTAQYLHRLAYVYALCDEREPTLDTLREAVGLGFSGELIRQEDEFRALRADPEFLAITASEPDGSAATR